MKRFAGMLLVVMAITLLFIGQSEVHGTNRICDIKYTRQANTNSLSKYSSLTRSRANKQATIHNDLKDNSYNYSSAIYREKRDDMSLICGQNALCGTLTGSFDTVYGHAGIFYYDTDLKRNLFVPIYAMKAIPADGSQYKIPKWDGKVFWLRISSDPAVPPRVLQPQFTDDNGDGTATVTVNASFCKQKDKDYSAYTNGFTLCQLYLTVNSDNRVTDYTMDVYDQDGNLSEEGLKLGIGDQIDTLHWSEDDDAPGWKTSMTLENFTTVEREPEFIYAGYIPGREVPCTECADKIVLADTDLYFRLEGWNFSTSTEPVWSEKQPLGKLKDNVCAAYPNLTTREPTLADVIGGLRILAALAPQQFCFRDVNNDGKSDMAEVIWMLQKIAVLR